jgi:diguanylate cyclase (GGDEF)-like protein
MDYENKSKDELIEEIKQYKEEIKNLSIEVELQKKELEKLSSMDTLSGLYNRRHIKKMLKDEFYRAQRYQQPLSCIIIDIDRFGTVNEKYGHDLGDLIIKELGKIIKLNSRQVDITGRYGGEEFIVILHVDNDGAASYAKKLINIIRNYTFTHKYKEIKITVSIGVSSFTKKFKNEEELINYTTKALIKAKETGRNRICRINFSKKNKK